MVLSTERGGREYVRLRTFNRHTTKGCWYPSPRYFVVPIEVAEDLADALDAAAYGEIWSEPPDWWHDFEKQYEKREWEGAVDADTCAPEAGA